MLETAAEADRLIAAGNAAEKDGKAKEACDSYRAAVSVAPRYAKAHLNLGIGLEVLGDTGGAIRSYEAALAIDAADPYANYNLGKLLHTRGESARAERLLRSALEARPDFAEAGVALASAYDATGKTDAAAATLEAVLRQRPDWAGALYNYGVILEKMGRIAGAESALERAAAADSADANALHALADLLVRRGRLDEAATRYRQALARRPDLPDAWCDLGNIHRERGRGDEAAACYRKAIALQPDLADAHSNLGNVLRDEGRPDAAIACYATALTLKPDSAEIHYNLGMALGEKGRFQEALESCRKALELKPDLAEGHVGMGAALKGAGRIVEAIESYRRALALRPDHVEANVNLAGAYAEQDRLDEARECLRRALSADPECAAARWQSAMYRIPAAAGSQAEAEAGRAAFERELGELERWFDAERARRHFGVVGNCTPFYLAYQEEDNREPLRRHGALCARIMGGWLERQALGRSRRAGGEKTVRVGIVSRYFQNHSVWIAIVRGWLRRMDRERFALHVFHLAASEDEETRQARSLAASFEGGTRGLHEWTAQILDRGCDALIYPEIGMDSMTMKLAGMRLAPVQATTWGHPETSGLPTIDTYLSAEAFEPAGAQAHYTERLVTLPHLGCHYEAPRVTVIPPDSDSLGIDPQSPVILCPGTPFKYSPRHDGIFPEIARSLGRCRFVFFRHKDYAGLSQKLRDRLAESFAARGLALENFVTFAPWQDWSMFYGLMERADVMLDTIGFSGFNNAMQAVQCGLPIVAYEGRFMRGRLASGILRHMGLHDLVAANGREFTNLAIRLCRDVEYRESTRRRIAEGREILFGDDAPIRALEDFLAGAVRG